MKAQRISLKTNNIFRSVLSGMKVKIAIVAVPYPEFAATSEDPQNPPDDAALNFIPNSKFQLIISRPSA